MKLIDTKVLSTSNPKAISLAQTCIQAGELIAFPTDTVYGLAADLHNPAAIEKLFSAKGRDFNKAIAVLIAGTDQLSQLTTDFNAQAQHLARDFWPGAMTIIVQKNPSLPAILSPSPTLGIRMPDHVFVRTLLWATGPLAVTSANISGAANPLTAQDVLEQLASRVNLILDGGTCTGGVPSTVVDCTKSPPVILREGAITSGQVLSCLNKT